MEYRKKIVDGHEVIYSSDWINNLETRRHFNWYHIQAELVYMFCQRWERILEIGVGTGLVSDLLANRGWNIKTLDIDEGKRADYHQNALDFDYKKNDINVIMAFEIFEHIPLETFMKLIEKISNHGVDRIYFSVPFNKRRVLHLDLKLPKIPRL